MQNLITFNDIPQLMVDVLAKLKELDEKMDRLAPSVKADEPQWFNVSALIDYSSFGSKNYQQPAILRFFRRSLQTGSSYQPCR
jgi:hypothetical protein